MLGKLGLPQLPPKPRKWPTAMLTEDEERKYLQPLLHRGWSQEWIAKEGNPAIRVAFLAKRFVFQGDINANVKPRELEASFSSRVKDIEEAEKVCRKAAHSSSASFDHKFFSY